MKYTLQETSQTNPISGKPLLRLVAVKQFGLVTGSKVKVGEQGGLVEGEWNLSQQGDCWVGKSAVVCDDARVVDYAIVSGNSIVSTNAVVSELARVEGQCVVTGYSVVRGSAVLSGEVHVWETATIEGCARLIGSKIVVSDAARIGGSAVLRGNVLVRGDAQIEDKCAVEGTLTARAVIGGRVHLDGKIRIYPSEVITKRPIEVNGLNEEVMITDHHIRIGMHVMFRDEWCRMGESGNLSMVTGGRVENVWNQYGHALIAMAQSRGIV